MTNTISYPTPPGYGDVVATWGDSGAIQSLLWHGKEFIDKQDHGRLLQSALVFDNLGEACNPTEGGSASDGGMSSPSTTRLLGLAYLPNVLVTAAQMAYWNPFGSPAAAHSNVILKKQVTLGYGGIWNVIEHLITYQFPDNEQHSAAQFEILTGYMPGEFNTFHTLDRATGILTPLAPTPPGEQPLPIICSTADGAWAMGCYVPAGLPLGGYGRWLEPTINPSWFIGKWNAVSRVVNPVRGGTFTFRAITAFGSRADVAQSLCAAF